MVLGWDFSLFPVLEGRQGRQAAPAEVAGVRAMRSAADAVGPGSGRGWLGQVGIGMMTTTVGSGEVGDGSRDRDDGMVSGGMSHRRWAGWWRG